MQKTYVRMRFLDIRYGPYLSAYFDSSAKKLDPVSKREPNEIQRMSNKYYPSMMRFRVSLEIFEMDLLRCIIYGVSWVFKIISYILINQGRANKGVSYFVHISQKFHMIALNAVSLNLIPYTQRTLF